tara:strand:+ start:612 stop:1067 length:456 start_codon:yes stop_codon:yes gene_type:complete
MKSFLLLSALLFYSNLLYSQGDLTFTYDSSGNQILRAPSTTVNKSMLVQAEEKDTIPIQDLKQKYLEEQIKVSAAPNPVSDLLTTTWENKEDEYFVMATLYSYNNRLLQDKKLSKAQSTKQFSFRSYPQGIYILVFRSNKDRKQSYKIIKR